MLKRVEPVPVQQVTRLNSLISQHIHSFQEGRQLIRTLQVVLQEAMTIAGQADLHPFMLVMISALLFAFLTKTTRSFTWDLMGGLVLPTQPGINGRPMLQREYQALLQQSPRTAYSPPGRTGIPELPVQGITCIIILPGRLLPESWSFIGQIVLYLTARLPEALTGEHS